MRVDGLSPFQSTVLRGLYPSAALMPTSIMYASSISRAKLRIRTAFPPITFPLPGKIVERIKYTALD